MKALSKIAAVLVALFIGLPTVAVIPFLGAAILVGCALVLAA